MAKSTNNIKLNSFFSKTLIDSNGKNCTDINDGLIKLFDMLNAERYNLGEVQRYIVSEYEDGYPDLVAMNSALKSQDYWWWILALNSLEDAFIDIKENWVYSINSEEQITGLINEANKSKSTSETNIGKDIELN